MYNLVGLMALLQNNAIESQNGHPRKSEKNFIILIELQA